MLRRLLAVLIPLGLAGCLSISHTGSSPPETTTIVVPPGSTVSCSNGQPGPC